MVHQDGQQCRQEVTLSTTETSLLMTSQLSLHWAHSNFCLLGTLSSWQTFSMKYERLIPPSMCLWHLTTWHSSKGNTQYCTSKHWSSLGIQYCELQNVCNFILSLVQHMVLQWLRLQGSWGHFKAQGPIVYVHIPKCSLVLKFYKVSLHLFTYSSILQCSILNFVVGVHAPSLAYRSIHLYSWPTWEQHTQCGSFPCLIKSPVLKFYA